MLNLTTIVDAVRDMTAALREVSTEIRELRRLYYKQEYTVINEISRANDTFRDVPTNPQRKLQFPVIPTIEGPPPATMPKSK